MPVLNFFIDKNHFPYKYVNDLDFDNKELLAQLGSANTWLLWTLRTYMELNGLYTCNLTDTIPDSGIAIFFRGSIELAAKPNKKQFWVCIVADGVWHPYSQVNLFQNYQQHSKYPHSYFMRHWHQLNIIKSNSGNLRPKNICYFGDELNLAPELRTDDWKDFLKLNGFTFIIPDYSKWNDYADIDIVIGIRSFSSDDFLNKPSSKLINAWRAETVFIGGNDSAFEYERQTEFDYIKVVSYSGLKEILLKLKQDESLYHTYKSRAAVCGERFPDKLFTEQWVKVIDEVISPGYMRYLTANYFTYKYFIISRFLIYRAEALGVRFKRYSRKFRTK